LQAGAQAIGRVKRFQARCDVGKKLANLWVRIHCYPRVDVFVTPIAQTQSCGFKDWDGLHSRSFEEGPRKSCLRGPTLGSSPTTYSAVPPAPVISIPG
jgi:hypothetical protein